MNKTLLLLLVATVFLPVLHSLTCYSGYRLVRGQSFGTETKECENKSDYCYNITADAAFILKIAKAGCSTYRCLLSANTCRSMNFQGVPVNFCCCNEHDLCNYNDKYE